MPTYQSPQYKIYLKNLKAEFYLTQVVQRQNDVLLNELEELQRQNEVSKRNDEIHKILVKVLCSVAVGETIITPKSKNFKNNHY